MRFGIETTFNTCGDDSPGREINSQAVVLAVFGPRFATTQVISTVRNMGVDDSWLTFMS